MATDHWFIGGGAHHTPEAVRRSDYSKAGGSEGVCGVPDLKVLPLAAPGGGVRVTIGSANVISRYVGGEAQMYMGTVYQQEELPIAATGSSPAGGRSDLIILRVEDPFAAGSPWPTPPDPATAQYVFARVITGVPVGTTRVQQLPGHENDTAVTLARIDIPANSPIITSGMIKDMRKLSRPRGDFQPELKKPTANSLTSATDVVWPANAAQQVEIPEWATEIVATTSLLGLLVSGNWVGVEFKARLGTTVLSDVVGLTTETAPGGTERVDIAVPLKIAIPEAMRGTTQPLVILAKKTGGTGTIAANARTNVAFETWLREKL